jgi:hypothetical protein
MIGTILDECPALTAQEVGGKIRERWWPGMDFKRIGPEFSTWLKQGRLARDDDGKLTLTPRGRAVAFPTEPKKPPEPAREPPKATAPAVQPGPRRVVVTPGAKLGPPARRQNEDEFVHGGKTILLSSREYLLATRLRTAIGKGHVSTQFLAETALGMKRHVDNETLIRDIVEVMNPKLQPAGLKVEFWKGFGFIMKELAE